MAINCRCATVQLAQCRRPRAEVQVGTSLAMPSANVAQQSMKGTRGNMSRSCLRHGVYVFRKLSPAVTAQHFQLSRSGGLRLPSPVESI